MKYARLKDDLILLIIIIRRKISLDKITTPPLVCRRIIYFVAMVIYDTSVLQSAGRPGNSVGNNLAAF